MLYTLFLYITLLTGSAADACPLQQYLSLFSLPLSPNQLNVKKTLQKDVSSDQFDSFLAYAEANPSFCLKDDECEQEVFEILSHCHMDDRRVLAPKNVLIPPRNGGHGRRALTQVMPKGGLTRPSGGRRLLQAGSCIPCTADEPQCTHPGQASQAWCDASCPDGENNDFCPSGYCTCGASVSTTTSTAAPVDITTTSDDTITTTPSETDSDQVRICYFENWVRWTMPILGGQDIFQYGMDASLCTHISYGFGAIVDHTWQVRMYDEWADPDGFQGLRDLKAANPHLKSLLSMGGWTWNDCDNHNYPTTGSASCHIFSTLVDSEAATRTHAAHVIDFLRENGFDGYDIDWEYPVMAGRNSVDGAEHPEDYDNYIRFLRILREEFEAEATRTGNEKLLLTAAVGVGIKVVPHAYNIPMMNEYLDWIGLMTYDLHGSWDGVTGLNAGLYATQEDIDQYGSPYSVEWAVDYWLEHGASAHKLVMGVAPYGRGFTLATPGQNQGPLSAISGASPPGPQVNEPGYHSYMEVVDYLAAGGVEYFDEARQTPYMITADGSHWIGYDNPRSLKIKTEFMMSRGLRGTMAWAIELDDFRNGEFPCLNAIKDTMAGYQIGSTTTSLPMTTTTTSLLSTTTTTSLPTTTTTTEISECIVAASDVYTADYVDVSGSKITAEGLLRIEVSYPSYLTGVELRFSGEPTNNFPANGAWEIEQTNCFTFIAAEFAYDSIQDHVTISDNAMTLTADLFGTEQFQMPEGYPGVREIRAPLVFELEMTTKLQLNLALGVETTFEQITGVDFNLPWNLNYINDAQFDQSNIDAMLAACNAVLNSAGIECLMIQSTDDFGGFRRRLQVENTRYVFGGSLKAVNALVESFLNGESESFMNGDSALHAIMNSQVLKVIDYNQIVSAFTGVQSSADHEYVFEFSTTINEPWKFNSEYDIEFDGNFDASNAGTLISIAEECDIADRVLCLQKWRLVLQFEDNSDLCSIGQQNFQVRLATQYGNTAIPSAPVDVQFHLAPNRDDCSQNVDLGVSDVIAANIEVQDPATMQYVNSASGLLFAPGDMLKLRAAFDPEFGTLEAVVLTRIDARQADVVLENLQDLESLELAVTGSNGDSIDYELKLASEIFGSDIDGIRTHFEFTFDLQYEQQSVRRMLGTVSGQGELNIEIEDGGVGQVYETRRSNATHNDILLVAVCAIVSMSCFIFVKLLKKNVGREETEIDTANQAC